MELALHLSLIAVSTAFTDVTNNIGRYLASPSPFIYLFIIFFIKDLRVTLQINIRGNLLSLQYLVIELTILTFLWPT